MTSKPAWQTPTKFRLAVAGYVLTFLIFAIWGYLA